MTFESVQQRALPRGGVYPFYSTYRIQAGTNLEHSLFRLFACTVGCTGQGFIQAMTMAQTNVRVAGVTPYGLPCEVSDVGIEIFTEPRLSAFEQVLDAASTEELNYPTDLNLLLRGSWQWDYVQVMKAGGHLFHSGLADREAVKLWEEGATKRDGCYASLHSYREPISLPPHPFGFGICVTCPPGLGSIKRDASIRFTLYLRFDEGLVVTD